MVDSPFGVVEAEVPVFRVADIDSVGALGGVGVMVHMSMAPVAVIVAISPAPALVGYATSQH